MKYKIDWNIAFRLRYFRGLDLGDGSDSEKYSEPRIQYIAKRLHQLLNEIADLDTEICHNATYGLKENNDIS